MLIPRRPWGNSLQDLARLQNEMSRLFGSGPITRRVARTEYPRANVWQDESSLVFVFEVPDVDAGDLDINVVQNTLSLRGQRKALVAEQQDSQLRQERPAGTFARSFELPIDVEPNQTEATLDRGLLIVKLARPKAQQPVKVSITPA